MVKNPLANSGDSGLISGSGRSPGEGNDNLVFLPGKSQGREAWRATIHVKVRLDLATKHHQHTHTHTHTHTHLWIIVHVDNHVQSYWV